MVRHGVDTLIKCLSMEPATEDEEGAHPRVRVFVVLEKEFGTGELYQQLPSVATLFACTAWYDYYYREDYVGKVLAMILKDVAGGGAQLQLAKKKTR